jgi:hypothetical protein
VGELLQAARSLRGAGLRRRRLVTAQPLRPDQDPAFKPAEQATRAEIRCPTRPQPGPPSRFAHAGLEGIEKGYKLPAEMTTNSTAPRTRSASSRASRRCPDRSARRSRRLRLELLQLALGEHIFPRTSSSSGRMGRVPHPGPQWS